MLPTRSATSTTTEALGPRAAHSTLPRFRLRVESGPDAGSSFESAGEQSTVGTHESASLVLSDSAVSRFHCEIVAGEGCFKLRDLGSRNGTFVDGVSVVEAHLHANAKLAMGRTRLSFELVDEPVRVPLYARERFERLVGSTIRMRRVFALLERAAESQATVLLRGETGTGKELAAESIHDASARRDGPFIVVDCGAIPNELLESELFGNERGAFTGAVPRDGLLLAASGGTLFLDEIGELGLELQPKLLRALDKREVKRLGSKSYAPIDVRVIAASNRDLRAEVNARRFRSDLYYRLAVIEIDLPPLRERPEDLPMLVQSILASLGAPDTPSARALRSPEFIEEMARHAWPGNVRELRNYLERCLALRETLPLEAPAGPESVDLTRPLQEAREAWNLAFERRYLSEVLHRHDDNVTRAARAARVDRAYFHRLLRRHGLR